MRKFLLFISILTIFNGFAQDHYFFNDKKINITRSKDFVNILVSENFDISVLPNDIASEAILKMTDSFYTPPLKYYEIKLDSVVDEIDFTQKTNFLKNIEGVQYLTYSYMSQTGTDDEFAVGTWHSFMVKLQEDTNISDLQEFCEQNNLAVNNSILLANWYELKIMPNNIHTILELCEIADNSELFEKVDPNFMLIPIPEEENEEADEPQSNTAQNTNDLHCTTNDTWWNWQWPLYNGYSNFYQIDFQGEFDINACEAWQITNGINANVAIIGKNIDIINPIYDYLPSLAPVSYNAATNTSPTNFVDLQYRRLQGIKQTAIIGSVKNNSDGVAGLASQSKIISIGLFENQTSSPSNIIYSNAIVWSVNNGYSNDQNGNQIKSQVLLLNYLTTSLGLNSQLLHDAIENAIENGRNGLGCLVVLPFSDYNSISTISYPSSLSRDINEITIVGTSKQDGTHYRYQGDELDVSAPIGAPRINPNNQNTWASGSFHGTSAAAYVAGTYDLMLSANPCLTGQQARDIIEQTAQKVRTDIYNYTDHPDRPNGTWEIRRGYGLIDAGAAVEKAEQMHKDGVDLFIKDSNLDMGIEPNNTTQIFWNSPDIWIRNTNDGGLTHQNPEYSANHPVYVYVRITNKGCTESSEESILYLYWANANTGLSWPAPWNGTVYNSNNAITGGQISPSAIPSLAPGEEVILHIPWDMSNIDLSNYDQDANGHWHFCILGRIDTSNDPMTFTETTDLNQNVKNNNNIAWRNLSVIDVQADMVDVPSNIASVAVGNPHDVARTYYLELIKDDKETGKPIYVESEIKIKMDEVLYNAWERGGKIAEEMENTNDEKKKVIKDNHALIKNINFNAKEAGLLTIDFSFLTEEMTDKDTYTYHLIQKDAITDEVIGGETFVIHKQPRAVFVAEADDKEVDKDETITISASQINEAAEYNWYDMEGNLVYQGKDMTLSTEIAQKFKLEVVATADGFKDYKEVEVKLKPNRITNISPNPTNDVINVSYKINDNASSYIMAIGTYGGDDSVNNYFIDIEESETSIDLSAYQSGYYTIVLVSNGQIVDAQTVLKN